MRWNKQDPELFRTITRFLLFPRKIGQEVRWLEWAKIRQYNAEGWWIDSYFANK